MTGFTHRLDAAAAIANAILHAPGASFTVTGDAAHDAAIVARHEAALVALNVAASTYAGALTSAPYLRLDASRETIRHSLTGIRVIIEAGGAR